MGVFDRMNRIYRIISKVRGQRPVNSKPGGSLKIETYWVSITIH